jgi:molecular chaperone DnaJ
VPRDYYEILGLSRDCGNVDIKRAFRRLARLYHPDVCKEPEAEERFKEIGEAYAILSDPQRRAHYDRFGHGAPQGFGFQTGFPDIFELFNEVFRTGFGAPPGAPGPSRGADLEYELAIDLAAVATGIETEVELPRQAECPRCDGSGAEPGTTPQTCPVCGGSGYVERQRRTILGVFATAGPCPECRGRGAVIASPCAECSGSGMVEAAQTVRIEVPAGIKDGQRIRHAGQGDMPAGGGIPGDLYVRVRVQPHEVFRRRDRDLLMQLDLSFSQAALGDCVSVPTIDGDAELTIPPGVQTGDALRLPGQGLPPLHGGPRGDQIMIVRVLTPTDLDDEERRILLELALKRNEEITPQDGDRTFFERIREAFASRSTHRAGGN